MQQEKSGMQDAPKNQLYMANTNRATTMLVCIEYMYVGMHSSGDPKI